MKYLWLTLIFFACNAEKKQIQTNSSSKPIVIYSERKSHLLEPLLESYENKTGQKFELITDKAGPLVQKLKTEKEQTPADILITVDAGNLWYAANEGVLEAVNSEKLNNNIPSHLKDPNNLWFGLSKRARTIVYHKERVKESELSTYEALAEDKWKGKLCLRTSKKVYNQSLVAMFLKIWGKDKTQSILSGWVKNTTEIFSSDTKLIKAIAAGQCDIGIVNTYYLGRLLKDDAKFPVGLFWPNQKDKTKVHVNISGAGIVKNTDNKEAAVKFLEWLSETEAQEVFAKANLEYPVNKKAKLDSLVESWGSFEFNTDFPLFEAGLLQQEAIKLMNEVNYK